MDVIGLVGQASSGNGELARFLQKRGYVYYSLSDTLRRIATSLELPHDREVLTTIGNTLREQFGSDILARGAKLWTESTRNTTAVVDSIRNPGEIIFLQQELKALIIGITMSPERQFELMKVRNRVGDPKTWKEFQDLLGREKGIGEKASGIQVQQCLELADIIIPNEGTKEDLFKRTIEILRDRGIVLELETFRRTKEGS